MKNAFLERLVMDRIMSLGDCILACYARSGFSSFNPNCYSNCTDTYNNTVANAKATLVNDLASLIGTS